MAKEEEEKKKTKKPTAQKRMIQSEKRRMQSKEFKSKMRTSIRQFEDSLKGDDAKQTQESLKQVYSMLDKGVKRGVLKLNQASRKKARLTARAAR